jgi:hypothetical protein
MHRKEQECIEKRKRQRNTYPITHEMLAHSLDPVQAQTVQHGARALHDAENRNGEEEPHEEKYNGHDDAEDACKGEGVAEGHGPEHDGELLVGEGEGPEAEVGCRVGDAV